MRIFRTGDTFPSTTTSSIFLLGPVDRDDPYTGWQEEALSLLKAKGYKGDVFVPIPEFPTKLSFQEIVAWEQKARNRADIKLIWVPRTPDLPGFTTNVEFGEDYKNKNIVFGTPPGALSVRYLKKLAGQQNLPVYETLQETVDAAFFKAGAGVTRYGGECSVPAYIFKNPSFQTWYKRLQANQHRLDGVEVLWTHFVGKEKNFLFSFALHVDVQVEGENRNKDNEFVLFRPSMSVVIGKEAGKSLELTRLVIINEFRSPCAGHVTESPGGSSFKPNADPKETAAKEFEEETGIAVHPSRVEYHSTRQVASTFGAHEVHLFWVDLPSEQIDALEKSIDSGKTFGNRSETELTYVKILRVPDLWNTNMDFAMLGMYWSVLGQ